MSDKPEKDCKFCNGSGKIQYQYYGEYCLDIAEDDCPCIEIKRLRADLAKPSEQEGVADKTCNVKLPNRCDLGYVKDGAVCKVCPNSYAKAKPSEWISVDDRLPVKTNCYIVWDDQYDTAFQAVFDVDEQEFLSSFDSDKFKDACITHWQPLPSPPDKETK